MFDGKDPTPVRRLVLSLFMLLVVPRAAESADFLVPGIDFSQLSFEPGAWCRYLVLDEALDQVDSTDVYVAVAARVETPQGPAYWVEIETRLHGAAAEDQAVMKALVSESIRTHQPGDSLGRYVIRLYVQDGIHPVREEDPRRFKDLTRPVSAADSTWASREGVVISTAAGRFSCTRRTRSLESRKEIPTGNVTLVRKTRDTAVVWFSKEIPVFHMAKCVIDRLRETETIPPIRGIPSSGRAVSSTVAELIAYGRNAAPILIIQNAPTEN